MNRATAVIPFLALAACTPNNATLVSGEYWAFIDDVNSISLKRGTIDPEKFTDLAAIDCRIWNEKGELLELEETFLLSEQEHKKLSKSSAPLRVGAGTKAEALDICRDWPELSVYGFDAPKHEEWIVQSPYWVLHEQLDPWRGEAILTSEGDLQITFHHRPAGGGDFRFSLVVDPDFQPNACVVDDATGDVTAAPYDGDWIAEWSKDLAKLEDELADPESEASTAYSHYAPYTDGTLYYLNASTFQFNTLDPACESADNCYWYLPETWQAGYAAGKFAEDDFFPRQARLGEPFAYNFIDLDSAYLAPVQVTDLWYCDPGDAADGSVLGTDQECTGQGFAFDTLAELADHARTTSDAIYAEAGRIEPTFGPLPLMPLVHDNSWRGVDTQASGLDAWVESHYNSVVFSADSDLTEGGTAKGAFTLLVDGATSNSHFYIRGEFEIEKIKQDKWGAQDLREDKAAEAGFDYDEDFCSVL